MANPKATALITIDHAEIRRWAKRLGGVPAVEKRTGSPTKPGIVKILFPPAATARRSIHEVGVGGRMLPHQTTWDNFFDNFEEQRLAMMYEPAGVFCKFLSRKTALLARHPEQWRPTRAAGRRAMRVAARTLPHVEDAGG